MKALQELFGEIAPRALEIKIFPKGELFIVSINLKITLIKNFLKNVWNRAKRVIATDPGVTARI
jgi:hypothetical protein